MSGESLRKICELEGMPAKGTIYVWLVRHPEFQDRYAKARQTQFERWAEEIIDIADGEPMIDINPVTGEEAVIKSDPQRDRLRVDTRKWLLSKLLPKQYGDKLELSGNKEAPLTVQVVRLADEAKP